MIRIHRPVVSNSMFINSDFVSYPLAPLVYHVAGSVRSCAVDGRGDACLYTVSEDGRVRERLLSFRVHGRRLHMLPVQHGLLYNFAGCYVWL